MDQDPGVLLGGGETFRVHTAVTQERWRQQTQAPLCVLSSVVSAARSFSLVP